MSFWRRLRYRAKGLILGYVPGMITCAEFEGFVGDYFEDRLALKQRRVFEWHLKMCRDCRDYLAAYRQAIETGKRVFEIPDAPAPRDLPEDLVQAILAARKTQQ